jgi:prevent-host-death family protein
MNTPVAEVAPISDLRHRQAEIVGRLVEGPVILTQRGRGTTVMLSMADWRASMRQVVAAQEAIEDVEDMRACDEIERRIEGGLDATYDHDEMWAEVDALDATGTWERAEYPLHRFMSIRLVWYTQ